MLEAGWPGLAALPRLELARFPTPVERLERLGERTGSELFIKRDDLTSDEYGGNKVRKLETLLGDAVRRRSRTIVTGGGFGSHHVLATAIFARPLGLEVHASTMAQPWDAHVEEHLRCALGAGVKLYPSRTVIGAGARMLELVAHLKASGQRPYLLAQGGSSAIGTVPYVEAGLELAEQIRAGELPEPDAVYIGMGSGGSAVGLAIGLAAAGATTSVVGVRVGMTLLINRPHMQLLAGKTVALLRRLDRTFPSVAATAMRRLRIDGSQFGAGYGVPTAEGQRAMQLAREREGLVLDATYTAKTFAAVLRDAGAGGRRLLYWHTLSSSSLEARLRDAPPVPRWALQLAPR